MKRIAAIVINSVSHDTRVLKEADSLAAAGYEVAVLGIQDNRCSVPHMVRPSGAQVHLCHWRKRAHVLTSRWILVIGTAAILLAIVVHVTLRSHIHAFVTSRAFVEVFSVSWIGVMALPFVLAYRRERGRAQAGASGGGANGSRQERNNGKDGSGNAAQDQTEATFFSKLVRKIKNALNRSAMEQELLEQLARCQPDAVHCHDLNTVPIGYAWKQRTGCPVVFDSHELYEEQSMASRWQKRVYQRRQRYFSDKIDAFITINDSIAAHLSGRYPKLPPAVIIKNAAKPHAPVKYDGRLHRAAALDSAQRILLFQGGFAQHRGLDSLVNAGALLPENWVLVMMGWGKFEPTLRSIARQIDPQGCKIKFIPAAPQSELTAWTAGATLGVIPYENICLNHWFCTPNKLWEYPVAGVPIIASPFPELSKTIQTWEIGLLLSDPVTPENIAATVTGLSDAQLERMQRNCRRYIEQDNWMVYEKRLLTMYQTLFNRGSVSSEVPVTAPSLAQADLVAGIAGASGLQSVHRSSN